MWELYKRRIGGIKGMTKSFTLCPTQATFLNRMVTGDWKYFDIYYNKQLNLIGLKEGKTKKITPHKRNNSSTCQLRDFCRLYGLQKSKWIFSHNEDGMDIYKLKEQKQ